MEGGYLRCSEPVVPWAVSCWTHVVRGLRVTDPSRNVVRDRAKRAGGGHLGEHHCCALLKPKRSVMLPRSNGAIPGEIDE